MDISSIKLKDVCPRWWSGHLPKFPKLRCFFVSNFLSNGFIVWIQTWQQRLHLDWFLNFVDAHVFCHPHSSRIIASFTQRLRPSTIVWIHDVRSLTEFITRKKKQMYVGYFLSFLLHLVNLRNSLVLFCCALFVNIFEWHTKPFRE